MRKPVMVKMGPQNWAPWTPRNLFYYQIWTPFEKFGPAPTDDKNVDPEHTSLAKFGLVAWGVIEVSGNYSGM